MGRFYNGDIEGKFWFGVQSSNDADFFGVKGEHPSELIYYYDEDDILKVEKGINACKRKLGKYKKLLDAYFKGRDAYNDEELQKELKINREKMRDILIRSK